MSMLVTSNMSLLLTSILASLIFLLSMKKPANEQMKLSFECGFSTQSSKNISISPHFFLITMLFLIFDIEISVILPFMMNQSNEEMTKLNMVFILMLFCLATMMEWFYGMIEWIK